MSHHPGAGNLAECRAPNTFYRKQEKVFLKTCLTFYDINYKLLLQLPRLGCEFKLHLFHTCEETILNDLSEWL